MMPQPPQWPSQPDRPAHPAQPPGGSPPSLFSSRFSSRSQLILAVSAVVSGLLIVALLGVLVLVLSSNARGATPGSQAQTGQTATAGTAGTTGTAQPTDTVAANSTSTPGSSGGGGTRHTPTPTPGTHAPPSIHQVVNQITLSGFGEGSVVATCPSGELALSGGWAVPYTSGATIYRSARAGTRGWAVSVNHPSSVLVTSTAECLTSAPRYRLRQIPLVERIPSATPGKWSSAAASPSTSTPM